MIKLFEAIRAGEFEAYTSELVMKELGRAKEPKRSNMLALVKGYKLRVLSSNSEVERLGGLYIENGIIPASHVLDSLHVAMTSVYELDYIISYNFHHINRNKTRERTMIVNNEEGYGGIMITTAKEVLTDD